MDVPIVATWPKCVVCSREAIALAPQSLDQGVTIDTWQPVCISEVQTWWDGSDWMGTFAWLSHSLPEDM
jgi:hypothetical protein